MMKKKYSLFLLAALITSLITHYTYAADNLESANTQNKLTFEEKTKIIEETQKKLSKHNIKISIVKNELYLHGNFTNILFEKTQKLLSYIFKLNWIDNFYLNHKNLTFLPKTIGNLTKLKILILNNNNIISLPETISYLTKLEILALNNNNIISLPETIGNLTKLCVIYLNNTSIASLPETMGNLTELQQLYLNKSHLTSLPETIGHLIKLKQLDLSNNQLITIPASIKNLSSLVTLNLEDNPYLLPRSDNPLEWGKEELEAHFGDRIMLDELNLALMSTSTTQEDVYAALDKQSLRINRDIFVANKLPDIHVNKIFEGEEMLQALTQIITSINFKDNTQPGYLSYEMLANDFASGARNDNLSNLDKVWTHLMPRLTGYIRTLYNLPLEGNDIEPWKMYKAQISETQKALTFIMERIRDTIDPDTKMLLFNLLVNGLLHCPTGQSEGINAVAYALSEGNYQTNNFKDNLKRFLAVKKNANFATSILARGADNSQNVHLISQYRDELKKDLGLSAAISSYHERMGILGQDPFSGNKWNVVQVFYDIVSPSRLIDWVMQSAETKKDREDEKNLRNIRTQKLSPVEHAKAIDLLRAQTRQNKQFRPFTTGSIAEYLYGEQLISGDENDHRWQQYFTADPLMDDFAVLTRDGAKAILIHEGFLIEDPKNEQIMSNKDIITD